MKKIRQRVRARPVSTTTEETVEIGNQPARQETSRRVVNSPIRSRGSYQRTRPTTTTTEKPEEDNRVISYTLNSSNSTIVNFLRFFLATIQNP